jgi:hypothetical protein
MKNSFKLFIGLAFTAALVTFSTSCDKEEDEVQKPYVGTWESSIYPVRDWTTGDTTSWEKMIFTFTNTTFEDAIFAGTSSTQVSAGLTMGGDIENSTGNVLDASINKIIIGGAEISLATQAELFESTFQTYLGSRLEKSFEGSYTINADTLVLTIPMKSPNGLVDVNLKLVRK